jgi:O-antigen/teichoic acid export membrane protein
MRVKLTIINSTFNIVSQIIQLSLSFIIRNLFIKYIGIEFLGLSSLFSNILSALNLADLGVGAAITFYLYRPMAEKDIKKIKGLMIFYKKTYYVIGTIIIVAGVILLPFIQILIKDQALDLPYIRILFLIQLAGTASTYFLAYKRTLLFVDQKNYIASIVDSSMNIMMMVVRVVALIYFKSYVIYLIVILIQNILGNVIITIICGRLYPYLVNEQFTAEPVNRKVIFKDLRNIVIEKVVGYIHYSTDNIIISKFIGLASAGFLANYTLITVTVQTFIVQITSAAQASFGNYINSGYKESDVYIVFKRLTFLCYFCTSFSIVSFLTLIQPFINLWLGEKYILPYYIIVVLCMTFFISLLRIPLMQMISIYGLFKEMKHVAILAAIVNLSISIVLIQQIGIVGTLVGTMLSEAIYWIGQTYYVLRKRLKVLSKNYAIIISKYLLVTLISIIITLPLSNIPLGLNRIIAFIFKAFLCIIIPNGINILLFFRTDELKYYKDLLMIVYNKSYVKIKINKR